MDYVILEEARGEYDKPYCCDKKDYAIIPCVIIALAFGYLSFELYDEFKYRINI